ncbi:MAG: DNA polymerase III subunit chi [Methylophilaceae bacterium]|nr:DNA polymerase III subunit chi [Methylophilaceae bacterium]
MTKIDFLLAVTNKLATVTQLVVKARAQKHMLTIYTVDATMSAAFSQALWLHPQFLAHSLAGEPESRYAPVLLDHVALNTAPQCDVLINLRPSHPPSFSRFQHLIEVIGENEAEKHSARSRYKFYRDRGYALRHINTGTPRV